MVFIRKATTGDVDQIVQTLCKAFIEDAFINYLIRQDGKKEQGFKIFFEKILTESSLPYHEVLISAKSEGAALWIPSEHVKMSLWKQILLLPSMIKATGMRGVNRMLACADELNKFHPREKHYYLYFIGVDPEYRKQSIASALLKPVLERCDLEGCGAYLENTNPDNYAFYERHAFQIVREIIVGKHAPPLWAMWRHPQG